MRIGEPSTTQTIEQVIETLTTIRSYAPFKYSGVWFVSIDPTGQGVAFRSLRSLKSHLSKFVDHGAFVSYAKVGGKQ